MYAELPPTIGKCLPAIWRSKNGKKNYYWSPERGTFRTTLSLISTGNRIVTRLAKAVAKYEVIESNDFGSGPIGYLVHGLTAKRVLRKAAERQEKADAARRQKAIREQQRERKRNEAEQRAALGEVGILPALFAINRATKRYRDMAARRWNTGQKKSAGETAEMKRHLYWLKGQVLEWMVRDGTLSRIGYHAFPGGNVAEVLAGQGYRFHRPVKAPAQVEVQQIGEIESKPTENGEVDEQRAIQAVYGYLLDRSQVAVYEWPRREQKPSENQRWGDDDCYNEDFDGSHC